MLAFTALNVTLPTLQCISTVHTLLRNCDPIATA